MTGTALVGGGASVYGGELGVTGTPDECFQGEKQGRAGEVDWCDIRGKAPGLEVGLKEAAKTLNGSFFFKDVSFSRRQGESSSFSTIHLTSLPPPPCETSTQMSCKYSEECVFVRSLGDTALHHRGLFSLVSVVQVGSQAGCEGLKAQRQQTHKPSKNMG